MPNLDSAAGASLLSVFSSELVAAISNADEPPLDEGTLQPELSRLLEGGVGDHLAGVSANAQLECLSGLWLVAGDIHRSHSISQDLGSKEGSFLHGIMHRREGDFGNAKYWFRRVGDHDVFLQLSENDGYLDPFTFVDECERSLRRNDQDASSRCRHLQWLEWQLLINAIVQRC